MHVRSAKLQEKWYMFGTSQRAHITARAVQRQNGMLTWAPGRWPTACGGPWNQWNQSMDPWNQWNAHLGARHMARSVRRSMAKRSNSIEGTCTWQMGQRWASPAGLGIHEAGRTQGQTAHRGWLQGTCA